MPLFSLQHFFQMQPFPSNVLIGHHDLQLVVLPYLIALLGSYLALDIVGSLRVYVGRSYTLWLSAAALALGISIWLVQFIGILAFSLPVPVHYNLFMMGLSLVVAIGISFIACFFLNKHEQVYLRNYFWGGILVGVGVAVSYFLAIEALAEDVTIRYLPHGFFICLLFAVLASQGILYLSIYSNTGTFQRQLFWRMITAFVIGNAVYLMHFLTIASTVFIAHSSIDLPFSGLDRNILTLYLSEITLVIFALALLVSTHKQSVNVALQEQNSLLIQIQQALRLSNRALEACPNGIIVVDAKQSEYPIIYVNSAFQRITGYNATEVLGRNCRFLQNEDHDQLGLQKIQLLLQHQQGGAVLLRNYRKDGSLFWNQLHLAPVFNEKRQITHYVGVIIDMTAQKILEDELSHQATHDALTSLPNRALLLDRLQQAIAQAKRDHAFVAVLFFDLDRFKWINDSLGHDVGDQLLQEVAVRLCASVRNTDTVARLGGDEFVIVLAALLNEEAAFIIVEKCIKELSRTFDIGENHFKLGSSIGVSFYPKDGATPDVLLKNADIAMYWTKELGAGSYKAYFPEMHSGAKERLALEHDLRDALEKQQFVLHYQPIFSLATKEIVSVEALLRWQHPRLGLLLPDAFLALLEEINIIGAVGEWVLQTACAQNQAWQVAGISPIKVAVNIAGAQLNQDDFVKKVQQALQQTKLAANYLELELTENIVMKNLSEIIPSLEQLRKIGVAIAIDDFGVGYSNLGSLKFIPVDKIKIAGTFIAQIATEPSDTSVIATIVTLAKSLGAKVIAEGIEIEQQLQILLAQHCDEGQGFYLSRPLPAIECAEFLRNNQTR
jgi:diguanylate cyclase (GGDEF)-like protein/PAS domain S-box-containing protein